ncbi:MAG: hypothetical protein IPN16_13730 [Gemmatimonadetes bacterium]|nr:hypothetical protein [Gemmatimonadota bacterium]
MTCTELVLAVSKADCTTPAVVLYCICWFTVTPFFVIGVQTNHPVLALNVPSHVRPPPKRPPNGP